MLSTLTGRYRCLALGRRGYGQSGWIDGQRHSFEREAQDVVALLATLDEPAHVFGHSSGAIVAATAAMAAPSRLRSLVLYEPPFPVGTAHPDEWLVAAEAAIDRGDDEDAVLTGMRDGIGFPPALIDQLRVDPAWPYLVADAPAWVREARTVVSLPVGVEHLAAITTPTLLLTGSHTEAPPHRGDQGVARRAARQRDRHSRRAGPHGPAHRTRRDRRNGARIPRPPLTPGRTAVDARRLSAAPGCGSGRSRVRNGVGDVLDRGRRSARSRQRASTRSCSPR